MVDLSIVMLVYQPGIFPGPEIGDIHILRCSHHGVSAAVQVPHGASLARSHWESTSHHDPDAPCIEYMLTLGVY
jgi:hypothetical protein